MVERIIQHGEENFNSVSEPAVKVDTRRKSAKRALPRPLRAVGMALRAAADTVATKARELTRGVAAAAMRLRANAGETLPRESLPRVAGVMVLFAAVAVVVTSSFVGVGLEVSIDGEPVGFVKDREQFADVIESVEAKASAILGYTYFLDADISYSLDLFAKESDNLDTSAVERALFGGIDEISQLYVLTVDGKVIGANADGEALEGITEGLLMRAASRSAGAESVELLQDVEVTLQYTPTANEKSVKEIRDLLNSNAVEAMTYTVREGDLFSDIAARHGMSAETLAELNPEVDPAAILEGDVVTISKAVPLMSIRTTEIVAEEVMIEHNVEYVYSSSYWEGDSFVTTKGSDGAKIVTSELVYVDGELQETTVLSEEVTVEPVTEVITLGTRNFILPFPGYKQITSTFGWRTYNGRADNHTGLDFAGAYGSRVIASYSGTVVHASWKGNYGNCVIIDHGNGYKTLYAHNSRLAVKVGDYVEQGDTIAYVGSTGKSSGPHCHFEIIINGVKVNPWKYLFG